MGTEKQYDEQIAPMLLEIGKRCDELGMSLIARVEWAPEEYGITQFNVDQAGIGQKLTQLAAHCKGNLDGFIMECRKRFDLSHTVVGMMFEPKP